MASSAKTGKFLLEGHRSTFLGQKHKSAIWNKTPPHLHIEPSLYVCRRVQGSQIFQQNWIILIHSRVILILLIWVSLARGGQAGGWGCLGWSTIVYMSSEMFRGKESSYRIELSWLVLELLNFGLPAALGVGGGWMVVGGGWGYPHTHAHACACMHTHVRTCMHGKHDNFMQMAAPIGGIHGNSLWCHMRMCMHVYVCGGHPFNTPQLPSSHSPPPTPIQPPPTPPGGPLESVKIQYHLN